MRSAILIAAAVITTQPIDTIYWFALGLATYMDLFEYVKDKK